MAATAEGWAKEATLKRAPLASVRHAAAYRVRPRFSHSRTHGAMSKPLGEWRSEPWIDGVHSLSWRTLERALRS